MNKRRKGFTLAEIVISVAILAIMSVYILKLFVSSDKLNEEALETDRTLNYAKSIFALIEASDSPLIIEELANTNVILNDDDIIHQANLDEELEISKNGIYLLEVSFTNERISNIGDKIYDTMIKISKNKEEPIVLLESTSIFPGGGL